MRTCQSDRFEHSSSRREPRPPRFLQPEARRTRGEVKSMRSARRADTIATIGAGEMGAAVGRRMLSKGATCSQG
jgi:hypothetical protein